jgi:ABC-type phosphate transport system substrate-binding protein
MTSTSFARQVSAAVVASATSLIAVTAPAAAASINGGGGTASYFDYSAEFTLFSPLFGPYYPVASVAAQTAFLTNNAADFGPGLTFSVDYAESDAPLTSAQAEGWLTGSAGQSTAANLIQIPVAGTAIAIPVVNTAVAKNGQLALSDSELCGIFSGKLTNWSQVSGKIARGQITVVYRLDAAGATFLLTNHFSAFCNQVNSDFAEFVPVTIFANLFADGVVPPNFIGVRGSAGMANELLALAKAKGSATGYLSPDYTSLSPNGAVVDPPSGYPLIVASILNGSVSYLPTLTNIASGLTHPGAGSTNLVPPNTAYEAANPLNWVPIIPTTTTGYPIVGYSTFLLAQCYASAADATLILGFLSDHYGVTAYKQIQENNLLAPLQLAEKNPYLAAIKANILVNTNSWNVNIQNPGACNGVPGR